MTPAELQQILDTVVTNLNDIADVAAGVDPALQPFIAIGKAIDKQLPGLASAVDAWLQGNPPTAQDVADLHQKLSVLSNPNLP